MEVRFFSLIKCPPRANFDRSHDGSATIFNFGPIGAKKGHLGLKRTLLGSLGAQKTPNIRPKCVLTMVPTQSDQSAAVGTKFSLRGLSGSL